MGEDEVKQVGGEVKDRTRVDGLRWRFGSPLRFHLCVSLSKLGLVDVIGFFAGREEEMWKLDC